VGDSYVDFRIVKQNISIEAVIARYGVRLRRANQHSLRGRCPLPTHSSKESTESFSIHLEKSIWACQSSSCCASRNGKKGGNVIDFVAVMEQCSIRDAALKLRDWFIASAAASSATPSPREQGSTSTEAQTSEKRSDANEVEVNKPLTFQLKDINYNSARPYLQSRGVSEETAQEFGIGFFPGRGSMQGRVVIPIHNDKGELVAYAGRSIDETDPKYKFPSGFHKSLELYNLHRAKMEDNKRRVVVVEGFFDCLAVTAAGFHSVALMGSSMSDEQEKLLATHFKAAWLMLDGDEAGRQGTGEILPRLVARMWTRLAVVPEGKQPDQLTADEIKSLLIR
jgi:DNA primase